MNILRLTLAAMLLAAFGLTTSPVSAQPRTPPPPQAFFDDGNIQRMGLSPNGRWLAAQVAPPEGGPVRLVMMDLQEKEPSKVIVAFKRVDVSDFQWLNDDLLVVSAYDRKNKAARDRYTALFGVRRDGEHMRQLVKFDFDTLYGGPAPAPLEANHQLLALGAPGSDEIIVGEYQYDAEGFMKSIRPFVLNARTGGRRSLFKNDVPFASGWLFDNRGRARLAVSGRDGQGAFHWLDLDTQEWKEIARYEQLKAPFQPAFVDGDGNLYVQVTLPDGSGDELRRFDFRTGKPSDEVLVATPGFDGSIDGVVDRDSGELVGYEVLTDAPTPVWKVPAVDALQKAVDARLKGRVNQLLCARCDKKEAVLVYSYSDRHPGEYLLFKPQSNQWQRLGARRPNIDPGAMAQVVFERIKARDGADLPVWVTLPPGPKKPRAAVVLVHGGPWVRGREWGWEPETQFLASRGYVVIEPEFRGSIGYGDRHFRAGFRQWGQTMQDDVSDAFAWAVKQGFADPARTCLAGASYGGYATLMGLAKRPDEFRCGVAWVAVSDPRLMFSIYWSDISRQSKSYSYKTLIGDPEKDAELLKANAPLELASRIKAPLLLAYGGRDRRVPIEHGERMRDALTKAGRAPEWLVYPDEEHGWFQQENQVDFWKRVESFLGKHLGP